jgi:hypothetical protein
MCCLVYSSHSSVEVKNEWSCKFTPTYACVMCTRTILLLPCVFLWMCENFLLNIREEYVLGFNYLAIYNFLTAVLMKIQVFLTGILDIYIAQILQAKFRILTMFPSSGTKLSSRIWRTQLVFCLSTDKALVGYQASRFGIYGRQSGSGEGFFFVVHISLSLSLHQRLIFEFIPLLSRLNSLTN